MRRAIRIAILVALGLITAFVAEEYLFHNCFQIFTYSDEGKGGKTKAELQTLSGAMKKLISEKFNTEEDLKSIHSMQDIAPIIGPTIEGNPELLDPWGNQYLLDRREEGEKVIFKIYSSHQLSRRCFEWKPKVLGMEITLTKQDGKVIGTRSLWQ